MKAKLLWTALLLLSLSFTALAGDKAALMIVAHGSPEESWNRLLLDVGEDVRRLAGERRVNDFEDIGVAFLEFAEPTICTMAEQFDSVGINDVYVVPLFIAPSGHSGRDVPAALGVYRDPEVIAALAAEGVRIPDTRLKFVIGPTLFPGDVIPGIVLDRVRACSTDPKEEAVVVLAHGDEYYRGYWDDLVHETGGFLCGRLGIEEHRGAFIHIGQSFSADGLPAIQHALEKKKTVIVANLFLSLDLEAVANSCTLDFMGHRVTGEQILQGRDVRYCRALLPDSRIAEWVLDTALEMATPPPEPAQRREPPAGHTAAH